MKQLKHNLPNDGPQQRSQKSGVCVCVCMCVHAYSQPRKQRTGPSHFTRNIKQLCVETKKEKHTHHIRKVDEGYRKFTHREVQQA